MVDTAISRGLPDLVMSNRNETNHCSNIEGVKQTARKLAQDIVTYVTHDGDVKYASCSKKYARVMRRVVDQITDRHFIVFNSMARKLNITEETGERTFEAVVDEMLSDGNRNWGRVVAVYALGAQIAKNCVQRNMPQYLDSVADFIGIYVAEKLSPWIHEQGGWDSFVEYFPEPQNVEKGVWRSLLYTALGLGALATMVIAR